MDPDPSLQPRCGSLAKLAVDPLLHKRSIPPRTDREKSVADGQTVAVAGNAELADLADPSRDLFALGAAFVEVMISRAKDHFGNAGQQRQILPHHHNLSPEIDHRSNVERISGEDDEVEMWRRTEQPIELRQRIMQIGNDKTAHDQINPECPENRRVRDRAFKYSGLSNNCAAQALARRGIFPQRRATVALRPSRARTRFRSACPNASRS